MTESNGRRMRLYFESCIPTCLFMMLVLNSRMFETDKLSTISYINGFILATLIALLSQSTKSSWFLGHSSKRRELVDTDTMIIYPGTTASAYRPGADDGVVWGSLLVPTALLAMKTNDKGIQGLDNNRDQQGYAALSGLTFSHALLVSLSMSCCFAISAIVNESQVSKVIPSVRSRYGLMHKCKAIRIFATIAVLAFISTNSKLDFAPNPSRVFGVFILGSICLLADSFTKYVINAFPRSFTLGESAIGVQSVLLVALDLGFKILKLPKPSTVNMELLCLESAVVSVIMLVLILYVLFHNKSDKYNGRRTPLDRVSELAAVITLLLAFACGALMLVANISRINPIVWVIRLVLESKTNQIIIIYWVFLLIIATIVYSQLASKSFIDSRNKFIIHIKRKSYHLLAVLMFVPGYLLAPRLMHVAFTVALVGFILVECIRTLDIGSFGKPIDSFMCKFVDQRDAGKVVTSHFYLLLGCALPIWMSGPNDIACLSGVLTLGIGDAFASLVGMKLGRLRWPGTQKTIEGTVSFVGCLFISILIVNKWSQTLRSHNGDNGFTSNHSLDLPAVDFAVAALFSGILEALTEQNDNLVIPIFMYSYTHVLLVFGLGQTILTSMCFIIASMAISQLSSYIFKHI